MKARLILSILLLVFIGVGAYLIDLGPASKEAVEVLRLSQVDHASINRIQILRENAETLAFTKQGKEWRLQSPGNFRARQSRIDAMLGILNSRSFYQIDAAEADLRLFQLAPPQLSLQLNELRFDFGGTEPIDQRRYVMTDNIIHLVNDSLYHQLRQASSFYASDRLVAAIARISGIDFQALTVAQQGDAAEDNRSALILAWQNAQAHKVSAYQRVPDSVEATIKLRFTNGRSAFFDVVSSSPVLVLGRADTGLQYSFNEEQSEKLLPISSQR